MSVCFDTNVLVSAIATRGICADIVSVLLAEHGLIIGATALAELRQILAGELRLPSALIKEAEGFLRVHATLVKNPGTRTFQELDSADGAILAEAIAGKADVLVTGDRDLLQVSARVPIKILSPRGFWELLRSG
ncbi:MAG: putative toxin-antitoxin system toxin component, PIN family [Steroidobacteraceae bacterium]